MQYGRPNFFQDDRILTQEEYYVYIGRVLGVFEAAAELRMRLGRAFPEWSVDPDLGSHLVP